MSGYVCKTPPAIEPISLDETKLFLRVDNDEDDNRIGRLITAAREYAEGYCTRCLITQTWRLTIDNFPNAYGYGSVAGSPGFGQGYAGWIPGYARGGNVNIWFANGIVRLYRPRLQKVNSISYVDRANVRQTLDPTMYQVDTDSEPGRIAPVPTSLWPFTQLSLLAPALNAITVDYDAGYGDHASDVPASIVEGMLLLIGHWYENRQAVITGLRAASIQVELSAQDMMSMHRIITAV